MLKHHLIAAAAGLTLVGGAAAIGPADAAEDTDPPERVTGVSTVIDLMENGSAIGPGTGASVAVSLVAIGLRPPVTDLPLVVDALGQPSQVAGALSEAGTEGSASLRPAVAPLAKANPLANAAIDAAAGLVDAAAETGGEQIQPMDTFLADTADFIRAFKE